MAVYCELSMNGLRGQIQGSTLGVQENSQIIDEWGHRWESGVVTYRLNNLSTDIEKADHQVRAVTVAFRTWQLRISDIRFKRERDPNKHVDINISFQPLSKFRSKGVLAHAWFPGQGEISGDIEINDEWDWVPHARWQSLAKPPLVAILIHEIGHSLGLRHDTSTMDSMMYPSFDLGKPKNLLHKNDIERIQGKRGFIGYGERKLSQRIIDYFRWRMSVGSDFK
jgi:hypothetical protein